MPTIDSTADQAIFFDGQTSRRHAVSLVLTDACCGIVEDGQSIANWPFAAIRRADAPGGVLRLSCLTAPSLARLEIRDTELARKLVALSPALDQGAPGSSAVTRIVAWSALAFVSILLVVIYGLPLVADRLTPLVPHTVEARIGEAADKQVRVMFDGKICTGADGQAAFLKLVNALRAAGGLDGAIDAAVLATDAANAFALPGGKIYMLNGLLQKAENSDEIAGVLAHELGHVAHRDSLRSIIYNGSTAYLISLLFGDVTGSSALIFASKTMFEVSYSREAEAGADRFSVDVMHRIGRPTAPMGDLLHRVTGDERNKALSFLSNHPFTEDRMALMARENKPATAAPILSDAEWQALRDVCN